MQRIEHSSTDLLQHVRIQNVTLMFNRRIKTKKTYTLRRESGWRKRRKVKMRTGASRDIHTE